MAPASGVGLGMSDKDITPGTVALVVGNLCKYADADLAMHAARGQLVVKVVRESTDDEAWLVEPVDALNPVREFDLSEDDLSPVPAFDRDDVRALTRYQFTDLYGSTCSIQGSSLTTDDAIWLGINAGEHYTCKGDPSKHPVTASGRMHLSRGQVFALLPLLQYFVETGDLPLAVPHGEAE